MTIEDFEITKEDIVELKKNLAFQAIEGKLSSLIANGQESLELVDLVKDEGIKKGMREQAKIEIAKELRVFIQELKQEAK